MIEAKTIADLLVTCVWAVPLVTGLVQAVKVTLNLEKNPRWIPLSAIVVGVVIGFLVAGFSAGGAVIGIILGLGSIGLYEVGKTSVAGRRG